LEEYYDTIGKRIRALRESQNLKRKDIADLLGISEGNLHSMENDKTNPSATTLIKLAKFFKVTSDWILLGDEINSAGEKEAATGFPITVPNLEMALYFSKIVAEWQNGDERIKTWVMVQLEKAFPGIKERTRRDYSGG
jgi:transcriptional regulator with XRE-family HTH domain